MPALTAAQLARVASAAYNNINKQDELLAIDKKKRPLLAYFNKMAKATGLSGGSKTFKNKITSDLTLNVWQGDDKLTAKEPNYSLDLTFPYFNVNLAITTLHDELKREGWTVLPNSSGYDGAKKISEDAKFELYNIVKENVKEAMDKYDFDLDVYIHRSGAAFTGAPVGLDGLLPIVNNTGTIGGKSRATYSQIQHYVKTGSTITAGGTLRTDLEDAIRAANLYNQVDGTVEIIVAGKTAIQGYKNFATANGINWYVAPDKGQKTIDIGIADVACYFEGIPVVHNPTFDYLDTIETRSTVWAKTFFGLNGATWAWLYQEGLNKYKSSPADPPDQRLSRMDLDGTYILGCKAPASNFMVCLA